MRNYSQFLINVNSFAKGIQWFWNVHLSQLLTLEDEMRAYERKYGVLSETFYKILTAHPGATSRDAAIIVAIFTKLKL